MRFPWSLNEFLGLQFPFFQVRVNYFGLLQRMWHFKHLPGWWNIYSVQPAPLRLSEKGTSEYLFILAPFVYHKFPECNELTAICSYLLGATFLTPSSCKFHATNWFWLISLRSSRPFRIRSFSTRAFALNIRRSPAVFCVNVSRPSTATFPIFSLLFLPVCLRGSWFPWFGLPEGSECS